MGFVRITGGTLARRRIKVPSGAESRGLRPTADKVRAAVFDILGDVTRGARVVDAFAGSGALGLEALSRGASSVLFLERDRRFARALSDVVDELGLKDRASVRSQDALKARVGPVDLALLDPPYAMTLDARFQAAVESWLAPGAWVYLERASRTQDDLGWGLSLVDERVYGSTRASFYRAPDEGESS
jgi:16S rRNA (guanine966-N2)-methyltransferase